MAADIGIRISLDGVAGVTGGLGVVGDKLSDLDSRTMKVGAAFKSFAASMVAGLSVASIGAFIKSGIDAADAANELSIKTGIATKDLAGLQLAFKQGGVSSDELGGALGRMSKQMVAGNDAFDKLGVKTQNIDGSMRDVKDVLYDTADAFAGMKDGAGKSALAMEVFGKTGADLIPTLNEGSQGLRDMADMADKLGLSIDDNTGKAADRFNDQVELLGMGLKGLSTQVAAQLLPTLTSLSASFLESMTRGDTLKNAAEALSVALKGLYTAGVLIAEVFNTVGKTIGAAGAAVMAVLSGDIKGAVEITKLAAKDIKEGWSSSATTIARAWDDSGNATVQALAKVVKTGKDVVVQTKAQEEASKKAAAEAKKQAEELTKLSKAGDAYLDTLKDKNLVTAQEITLGRALTESEKAQLDLENKLRDGKLLMTPAIKAQALAQIELNDQNLKHRALQEAEKKLNADLEIDRQKIVESLQAETGKLREAVEAQAEQNEKLSMTEAAYAQLTIKRMLDLAAQKEETAATSDQSDELLRQAELLRKRAQLAQEGIVVQEARAAADEWKKTTEQIEQGLTDSLFRAFEAGKGFFDTLWDGIVNTFKTTVLRLTVDMVMKGTGLSGLLAGAGGASAGGGAGVDAGSLMGLAGSFGSGLGALGSLGMAGAGMTMAGETAAAFAAAQAAITSGATASGVAIGLGAAMPYIGAALGVYALYKKFSHESTPHAGAGAMSSVGGTVTGAYGFVQPSIKADRDKSMEATVGALTQTTADMLNTLASLASGGKFAPLTVASAFADDKSKDAAWGEFRISQGGKSLANWRDQTGDNKRLFADGEKGFKEYVNAIAQTTKTAIGSIGLPEWAKKIFDSLGGAPTLEELAATVDKVVAVGRVLKDTSAALDPLGGVFERVAKLSGDATLELAGFVGGLEALVAKSQGFVSSFYSEGEQAAITASGIVSALGAVGIKTDFDGKAQFRALVDSIDVGTTVGRQQFAALLNVSNDFARLTDYMKVSGLSLQEIAKGLPALNVLDKVAETLSKDKKAPVGKTQEELTTELVTNGTELLARNKESVTQLTEMNSSLTEINSAIVALQNAMAIGLNSVSNIFVSGLSNVVEQTRITARVIQSWDDGGAILTTPAP